MEESAVEQTWKVETAAEVRAAHLVKEMKRLHSTHEQVRQVHGPWMVVNLGMLQSRDRY